jgi:DHA2 family multidrug resistance protein
MAATKQMSLMVRRQAEVMALADVFLAVTAIYLIALWLTMLMRRPQLAGAGGGGH